MRRNMGMHLECTAGLVGKGETGQPFPVTNNVERARKHHDGALLLAERLLNTEVKVDVVDARHVAGTRR